MHIFYIPAAGGIFGEYLLQNIYRLAIVTFDFRNFLHTD